jgi:GxxExxY protein
MQGNEFRCRAGSGVDEETERLAELVIGAAIEVHRELGPGLPEISYCKAMSHELDLRGIPHECEAPLEISYKGKLVGQGRIDILVDRRLIVEIKAVESLNSTHRAQVITYLQVTKLKLGLLINFNVPVLKDGIRRVVNTFS